MNSYFEKAADLLMFREGTEETVDGKPQPVITTGSIVWGILLRSAILIFISFFVLSWFDHKTYIYFFFFVFWFAAAYPGWRQFQLFQERMKKVSEDTLCGSCIHFEPSSQLCKVLDEHITETYIPCEGLSWEPRHFDSVE